jgi:5-methylcytosine-specific restriction endonuclease McrA
VVPVSAGGANTIDNIQPLCGPCNSAKHTQTIDYRPVARVA